MPKIIITINVLNADSVATAATDDTIAIRNRTDGCWFLKYFLIYIFLQFYGTIKSSALATYKADISF